MFTPGFDFLVGSVFPFSKTCVHSRFCFLGRVCLTLPDDLCSLQVLFIWWGLSYPSRGSVFTPGFVFLVGSVFPFSRNCARSRFCFLCGVCPTLPEDLCSLQVLFSWWGLSYPSRGPVFTPGFVFLVGSVFPFSRNCARSRFCFLCGVCRTLPEDLCSLQVLFSWWGLSYPSRGPVFTPGFVFLVGVCLTLPEDLCSLQVLFSWWGLSFPSRGTVLAPGFVFLVGSVLPFSRNCARSRFCFLGGVCFAHRYRFLCCVVCYV